MIEVDTLYTMTYTLNSGIKGTVNLSLVQIKEWIDCFKIGTRFVTYVGDEHFGLNPNCVADYKVHNVYSEQRRQLEVIQPKEILESKELLEAYEVKQIVARVECKKCSTQYTTDLIYKMPETICTKCKSKVYLQEQLGMINTNKGKAYYYSNNEEEQS
ncbi:hypothetical protein SAMN04487895_101647 [Paenibacillus sophorae]|uniref:Uncharacterized protein n=2 Tax=Paenibacillus sophorae TaxID=1333845 RepID=A0A1H8GVN7_9BACL|nr:hypothetical protein SAMN04487895_101647 [Paenibacillus sophorae]